MIKLTSLARRIGTYRVLLGFEFERPSAPGKKIHILRHVHASVTNSLIEELMPKEPYKRPPRKAKTTGASNIDEGLPPSRYGLLHVLINETIAILGIHFSILRFLDSQKVYRNLLQ